eukprot:TRINITY_DN2627_c0_g1_i1.p1 TRINITY_DN2627_c0_g1~~TRINITY_DN2627_c0_g1_i1.p1  ORF type:complete len:275 (-),score=59.49 TRINITY_DN2627_c0_g1_i1:31-801(-)
MASGRQVPSTALLAAGVLLAAVHSAWNNTCGFVATSSFQLNGMTAAAVPRALAPQASGPMALAGDGLVWFEEDAPRVAMQSDGGRRKRLGVGGRVCMLTGRKKFKGFERTYGETKHLRYWRPNTRWKDVWWEKEQKWVRLYISVAAQRKIDKVGLESAARSAGLDLYAWTKDHWEPGSRQPLCLKVGYTGQAKKDLRQWPDYIRHLNKGKPLADRFAGPERRNGKPIPWHERKAYRNPPTPPKLKVTMASDAPADA